MIPKPHDFLAWFALELAKLPRPIATSSSHKDDHEFYERFFDSKDAELYKRDPRMVLRRKTIAAALRRHVSQNPRLLDIGCGLGDVLASLPENYRIFGVDASRRNVKYVQARLGSRTEIREGIVAKLPYDDGCMDVCLCLEVLEHVQDDAKAVEELSRVLRSGGTLIASVPHAFFWPRYQKLIGHFRHYDRSSFVQLLESNGFRIEEHLPNYPRWHRIYMRRYLLARGVALLASVARRGKISPYDLRWPGTNRPALDVAASRLEGILKEESSVRHAELRTSTFVVAKKVDGDLHVVQGDGQSD